MKGFVFCLKAANSGTRRSSQQLLTECNRIAESTYGMREAPKSTLPLYKYIFVPPK